MNQLEEFYTALDEAISRAGNMNRLCRLSGIPVNSLTRWVKRERTPTLESLIPLLPFIDWPKRSQSKMPPLIKPIAGNAPAEPVVGDDLVRIPVMIECGAGGPRDVFDGEVKKWIEILPKFNRSGMRAVEVVGDSMEPTIQHGALIGVMPFEGTLREGGIYLCRLEYFGLVCKRVRAAGPKGLRLISDNPAYEPMDIPPSDCEGLIVGEVVWCLQGV